MAFYHGTLKEQLKQKWKFCDYLLALMSDESSVTIYSLSCPMKVLWLFTRSHVRGPTLCVFFSFVEYKRRSLEKCWHYVFL